MSSQLGSEIGVRIFAETGELKPGMDSAANDVERSAARMQDAIGRLKEEIGGHMSKITGTVNAANDDMAGGLSSVTGAFGKVSGAIAAVGALLAGGAIFRAGVDETKKFTGEAVALSKALGISASEAATLNVALGDIYSSSETFIGAATMLGRQLRTNEEGLNAMGLKTRDANGEFRGMKDLMMDGITVLNGYKEGTDRNLAAQSMFGRGGAEVMAMLKLNNEVLDAAKEKQEQLGLVVGVENVAAAKEYKAAMNDVGDVMTAIRKAIGDAVMPVLTKLGEWFSVIGPAAVTVIKGAVGGLIATFWALKNGVAVLWETINAMVVSVAESLGSVANAIFKAMTGDFEGAKNALSAGGNNIADAWKKALKEMGDSSEETAEKIGNLFNRPTEAAAKVPTGKSYVDPNPSSKKDPKAPGEKSQMPAWEAELAREKAAFMLKNDMYEMSVEQEKKYWDDRLQTIDKGDKEYGAIEKKQADLSLQILKKKALDGRALTQEEIEEKKRFSLSEISIQQQAAEQAYAMCQISYSDMLQLDRQFEQERYDIEAAAIQERLALLQKDPNMSPVEYQKLKNQLLEIDRKHMKDKKAIEGAIKLDDTKPMLKVFDTMKSSFSSALTGMLTGAMNWRQALRGIFSSLLNSFVENLVTPMLMNWAMSLLRQTTLYQTFFATKATQDATAATTTAATNTAEAMSAAGLAGANATASAAAIPIIGWAMAPEAGAAVYAVAAGFAATASASGGYDVPSGVNPITQLHQEEMVLPAKHANVIRSLADGGEGGGGSVHHHYHIKAFDGQDVKRVLMKHSGSVVAALKEADRKFAR